MKQSLQLRIGQSLTMTPQLQQAIRLLQLSTLELQTEIQEVLESNPMLEVEEDSASSDPLENTSQSTEDKSRKEQEADTQADASSQDLDMELNNNHDMPEDLPVDSQWDDIYEPPMPTSSSAAGGDDDKAREFLENQSSSDDALIEHLMRQLLVTPMSDTDRAIALAIIDGIDEDGYLKESVEDILSGLQDEFEIELDEVEAVLHLIQRFDPLGVGARDLRECLLLQMEQFSNDDFAGLKKPDRL